METLAEVARLREVYGRYASLHFERSKWSNANHGNQAIQNERDRKTRGLLQRAGFFPLANKRILDIGCGTGQQLGLFVEWGARPENLVGVDLIPDRIRAARERFPRISFHVGNAESLAFADGAFDLVALYTVFTSILNRGMAANIAAEIDRLLAPGGAVLWYDFRINNPFNQNVRGMTRKRIKNLFPHFRIVLEAISLVPPLARRLGNLTDSLYAPLSGLPFLQTHLLGLFCKPRKI